MPGPVLAALVLGGAAALARTRTGNPGTAKTVKCPMCNDETEYSPATDNDCVRMEDRCSHEARAFNLTSRCVVCSEEDAGPPMIGLRCGHCVCAEDFKGLGGKMGDDAMMTPNQAAEADAANNKQDTNITEDLNSTGIGHGQNSFVWQARRFTPVLHDILNPDRMNPFSNHNSGEDIRNVTDEVPAEERDCDPKTFVEFIKAFRDINPTNSGRKDVGLAAETDDSEHHDQGDEDEEADKDALLYSRCLEQESEKANETVVQEQEADEDEEGVHVFDRSTTATIAAIEQLKGQLERQLEQQKISL